MNNNWGWGVLSDREAERLRERFLRELVRLRLAVLPLHPGGLGLASLQSLRTTTLQNIGCKNKRSTEIGV